MKVVKVRSPFIITVAETGQIGSKIELSIWNNGNSIPTILSGVTITGTAGQFSCTAATFATGDTLTISGTLAGTGTIVGYTSPKTYYVIATNGTTTFTLSETLGGTAIVTTAGTPTGLTYITEISGFYSLSKAIPSASQITTNYNVSNYVKEFINNIYPNNVDSTFVPVAESSNEWVKFRVTRYKLVGSTYTSLDSTDYVGVNGFISYDNGYQVATDSVLTLLANPSINNYYWQSTYIDSKIEYLNLLIDKATTTTTTVVAKYERIDGTVYSVSQNIMAGVSGIANYRIPITRIVNDAAFINGCKVTLTLTPVTGSPTVYVFNTYPVEECKYATVRCSFINRYGGWKDIIFFKAQTNTIAVKGTDYKLTQDAINYNTSIGQFKTFNLNGKQTIKLNTGFVDENYSELITDLLLSETVLLDGKPVTVKTQGSDLKTSLKDKLINYEIEFEYAYNLINDVV